MIIFSSIILETPQIHLSSSTGGRNMRTLLAVFIVLMVSGDDETFKGVLEGNILLPCNCSERDFDEEFQWQMEEPRMSLVLKHTKNISNFYDRYKGRAEIFLSEDSNNCSILIINITADDQGMYKCSFVSQGQYKRFLVNLIVPASYNVCLSNNTNRNLSAKVFQCDVQGRYREAEIQWKVDGQLLANSTTTSITPTYPSNAPTGLYHFKSTVITKLNSEPTCHVKAKGLSTVINHDCGPVIEQQESQNRPQPQYSMHYLIIIPVVLVLGFTLFLWHRWKFSQRLPTIREGETDNILC